MGPLSLDDRLVLAEALRRKEAAAAKPDRPWCPHKPFRQQQQFLSLTCLEALYGGAAGGGKSDTLLMGALEHVDVPGYAALILRRTYADLALPGAIMDRAKDWLAGTGARWHENDKRFTFPSGAVLQFGYLEIEKHKYRYQGAEFQYIAFDELTQFTESQYRYMLSRCRRKADSTVPLRVRSASNPGGIGHDWVHKRFVKEPSAKRAFVPALLDDNPHLDQEAYREALANLDSTTLAQLLKGLWVRDGQGLVYKYDDERNGFAMPPAAQDGWLYVLGVDLGSSQTKPTTAFVVLAYNYRRPDEVWVVESRAEAAMIPSTVADAIRGYQGRFGITHIVCDAGALGKGYVEEFRQRHALPVEPARKQDKLAYRRLLNGDLERAVLRIVTAANDDLVQELQELPWDEKGLDAEEGFADHLSDAMLYGWREARHWLAQAEPPRPKPGTPEAIRAEEDAMEEAAEREYRRSKKSAFG